MGRHSGTGLLSRNARKAWSLRARCAFAVIALLSSAAGNAASLPLQQLTVAFTNAFPNGSVDSLTMPNPVTAPNAAAIVATNSLFTGGTPKNLYTALTWVTNPATSTLDLIYADAEQHQIWRLPGPNYQNPIPIFSWSSKGPPGPPYPMGLAADTAGNVYVISPSSTWGKPGVWVLPFNASAVTYYGNPLLIDNTFNGVTTLALAEVLVAGTAATGGTWSADDLLVLVGDTFNTRVIRYSGGATQQIQSVLAGHGPVKGPASTIVTQAQFLTEAIKKIPPIPVGMDIGQNPTTNDITLLFSTADGRILDFDSATSQFITPYAINLGLGLTRLKVGTFQATQYVFVGQLPRQILEFAAPGASGPNTLATKVASVSTGVSNPTGLATTNSGSVPATGCVSGSSFTGSIMSNVLTVSAFASGPPIAVGQTIAGAGVPAGTTITSFGTGAGGIGTYNVTAGTPNVASEALTNAGCAITPQFTLSITGVGATAIPASASIGADSCTFEDTRVVSPGQCPVETTLDIGMVCSNMPHVTLPTTICGGWGVTGASISATKVSASTVNQHINNTLTRFLLNPTTVLPPATGALNPTCGATNGPIAVWAPLPVDEAPIPEDKFIDITVACTTDPPPGGGGSHPSILLQGTVNAPLTAPYINGEFTNLQTAFTDITTGPTSPFPQPPNPLPPPGQPAPAMEIVDSTGTVVPNIQSYITNSRNFFNQQNQQGYNCALNTLWQGAQYVNTLANTPATSPPPNAGDFIAGTPPYDQNPSGTLLMRFDHLYYDVYIFAGIATTGMSPPALTTDALQLTAAMVPPCVALNQPNALAFNPNTGNLYVANYGSGQVLVYAPVGQNGQMVLQPAMTLGGTTSQPMANPARLAFGPTTVPGQPANPVAGYLFVADPGNNTVEVFDQNGNPVSGGYGPIMGLTRPLGVAVDSSGLIYVAENYGGGAGVAAVEDIRVFFAGEGWDNCATFTQDSNEQQFNTIGALAYNGTDLLVGLPNEVNYYPTANLGANPGNCSKYGIPGGPQLPPPAPDPNQVHDTTSLNGVTGIAVDSSNNVDVTNYYISTTPPVVPALVQFAPFTGTQTTLTLTGTPNPIGSPEGVAVDGSGNIYVADAANNVIYVYTSAGIYSYSIH